MTRPTRPGEGPAFRVVTSHTATPEQRQAAHDHLAAMAADDLLWAAPGEQMIEPEPPRMFRVSEERDMSGWIDLASSIALIMAGWVLGILTAVMVLG